MHVIKRGRIRRSVYQYCDIVIHTIDVFVFNCGAMYGRCKPILALASSSATIIFGRQRTVFAFSRRAQFL